MTQYAGQDLSEYLATMDLNQPAFRHLGTKDYDWFDQSIRIDTDCVCASSLTEEEKSMVYDRTIPEILNYYRAGHVPSSGEADLIMGQICANSKASRSSVPGLRPNATAHAVMKFMLYIITKDLDISGKKVDSIPQIASFIIYKAISKHYKIVEYDHQTRKDSGTIMSFSDPIFLNDSILELCRDGDLSPFRTLNDQGEPPKVHIKAYRNFHDVLLKLDKHEFLTGYTKATVGYLAIKMYFDNMDKAKKHNDMLWVTAQWLIQAPETIFRWRHDEVWTTWSKWRAALGDREVELREARGEQGNASDLEKSLIAAREQMRLILDRMKAERQKIASYRAGESSSK
ncbi:hypothetical protein SLS62_005936 [Diatrype stigma]|uniref:Uncharacterized protein n=1 Tax=Diatrype stigma TaxID=117547 RepID=A0AAN9YRS2_9PEZI